MDASLHPITRTVVRVQLTIRPEFEWRERAHGQALRWLFLVEDSENEHVYHSEVGEGDGGVAVPVEDSETSTSTTLTEVGVVGVGLVVLGGQQE